MRRSARPARGAGALAACACALAACAAPPAAPRLEDADAMARLAEGGTTVFWREGELARAQVAALLPELEAVRLDVGARLGVAPPRTELLVWAPAGVARGRAVRDTQCELAHGRIRFVYPWEEGRDAQWRAQLLGTLAHEVAEGTLLTAVAVIDPYLRWLHDGLADLVEHEVLRARDPAGAAALLERALAVVADRRARGESWVDLGRWRQLAPWVIRSHALVADGKGNLSLDDLPGARARVAAARAAARDAPTPPGDAPGDAPGGARARALAALEGLLARAADQAALPWRPGEARADDPETRDLLHYHCAFAVWLDAERARPGLAARVLATLEARRAAGDHVLGADDARALFEAEAGLRPPLERLELRSVEAALRRERTRLGPTGPG